MYILYIHQSWNHVYSQKPFLKNIGRKNVHFLIKDVTGFNFDFSLISLHNLEVATFVKKSKQSNW